MEGDIAIDHFRRVLNQTPKSNDLIKKAIWLLETYECFKSDKLPPHKQTQQHKHVSLPTVRKSLVTKDLSVEAITKKHITTLMNKLTSSNKEHILNQLRSVFREDHSNIVVDIIWEFMLISPEHQDIYTDALLMLTPHVTPFVSSLCDKWLTTPETWQFDKSNTQEYDEFCDYVKQKRRAVSAIRGFGYFFRKQLISVEKYKSIVSALYEACNLHLMTTCCFDKVDVLIEQFKSALPAITSELDVSHWIETAPSLPPSLRFKIYDIRDKNL